MYVIYCYANIRLYSFLFSLLPGTLLETLKRFFFFLLVTKFSVLFLCSALIFTLDFLSSPLFFLFLFLFLFLRFFSFYLFLIFFFFYFTILYWFYHTSTCIRLGIHVFPIMNSPNFLKNY